jgi:hypothetical protein
MLEKIVGDVHQLLLGGFAHQSKVTPSGWRTRNCPMCGDTRRRGGVKIEAASIGYHCFNCGYSTRWEPGKALSDNFTNLAAALGTPQEEINRVRLTLMKSRDLLVNYSGGVAPIELPRFRELELPASAQLVSSLSEDHPVKQYAVQRGLEGVVPTLWFDQPMWRNRLVIPFMYEGRLVGWTGRHALDTNTPVKYMLEKQAGYVYNMDSFINSPRQYAIVVEGVIDAALIDAMALLTNSASPEQVKLINTLPQQIVFCPDRDRAGKALIEQALDAGWMVSFPPWEKGVKDAADAVDRYGRALTVSSILTHATSNPTKIRVLRTLR